MLDRSLRLTVKLGENEDQRAMGGGADGDPDEKKEKKEKTEETKEAKEAKEAKEGNRARQEGSEGNSLAPSSSSLVSSAGSSAPSLFDVSKALVPFE